MEIEEIRKSENIELAKCIKSFYNIIEKKCSRCNAQSCMGCVFSSGEMMFDWYHIVHLLTIQDNNACLKGFNMDQEQFDHFFKKFKEMYAKSNNK